MVVRGQQLEVESRSARYAILLGDRDVKGTSVEKVFDGEGFADFLNTARQALAKNETIFTPPMDAHVLR